MVSSSKAYLLKLGKNLPWEFEVIYIFLVKFGFKYMPISHTFLTYNKINNKYSLNFDHLLLQMSKIIENS